MIDTTELGPRAAIGLRRENEHGRPLSRECYIALKTERAHSARLNPPLPHWWEHDRNIEEATR